MNGSGCLGGGSPGRPPGGRPEVGFLTLKYILIRGGEGEIKIGNIRDGEKEHGKGNL
jgi:hypothetical protein